MRLQLRVLEHHIDDTIRTGRSFSLEHEDLEDMRNSIIHAYMNRIGLTRGDKIEETFCKFFKSITLVDSSSLKLVRSIYPSTEHGLATIVPGVNPILWSDELKKEMEKNCKFYPNGLDVPPSNE